MQTATVADHVEGAADPASVPTEVAVAGIVAQVADFPELHAIAKGSDAGSLNQLLDVAVQVTAEIGRTNFSIGDILKFGLGSVVELDRAVSEPIDLLVQGVPFGAAKSSWWRTVSPFAFKRSWIRSKRTRSEGLGILVTRLRLVTHCSRGSASFFDHTAESIRALGRFSCRRSLPGSASPGGAW